VIESLSGPTGHSDELPPIDPREETETRLGNLRFNAARDTRDTFLWPTDGSYTRTDLAVYDSALFSEADYLRGFIQWNRYQKVLGPALWVSSVRLGLAQPYGDTEALPISERYFTGGDSSIRGHKYDSLPAVGAPYTPDNESDASTGGNAMFLFNQELVVPVFDPLFMVLFYDAGNLYWQVSDFDITDLRHSAGLGIRIKTPVGPLRLEYGWKLDREEGESIGRLHFSFGMPF
jgi:outer membrane protein insertion porin family